MSTKKANVTSIASAIETPIHVRIVETWKGIHRSYSEVHAEIARHPSTKEETKLTPSRMRTVTDRDLAVVFPDKDTRKAKSTVIREHDTFVAFESLLSAKLGVAVRVDKLLTELASGVEAPAADAAVNG